MAKYSRRGFIRTGIGMGAAIFVPSGKGHEALAPPVPPSGPKVVSSGNGIRATAKAMELMKAGGNPMDAVIAGVNIVEDDPDDMSVGYGGLPNAEGVVELDASVMYGPTHTAGAVASLRNIKNPSKVARRVMETTPHVLLVGEGALKFARAQGFKEENLLTEKARDMWLKWKNTLKDKAAWMPPHIEKFPTEVQGVLWTYGTINCLALDGDGRLAGVTTTSGLSWKLSGRVGDSPIIGAGLYVDNDIGAAGSTGLGEANLQTCASFQVVDLMGRGLPPEEACIKTCEIIARKARLWPRLHDADGRPNFGLSFYALNKKGQFGSASIYEGGKYAVHDGTDNKLRDCSYLYKRPKN